MNMLASTAVTMTSVEIAEFCGKAHKHVLTDIRRTLTRLGLQPAEFSARYTDAKGEERECMRLPRRETLIVVSGYRLDVRARIVDHLDVLERALSTPTAIPDFADPVAAARAWADEREMRVLAEATKAEIGSRREATAMNTASQAIKVANRLQIELDQSRQYASVKRMEKEYGRDFSWPPLRKESKRLGLAAKDIDDANYGTVKAYHAEVWRNVYNVEIPTAGARR